MEAQTSREGKKKKRRSVCRFVVVGATAAKGNRRFRPSRSFTSSLFTSSALFVLPGKKKKKKNEERHLFVKRSSLSCRPFGSPVREIFCCLFCSFKLLFLFPAPGPLPQLHPIRRRRRSLEFAPNDPPVLSIVLLLDKTKIPLGFVHFIFYFLTACVLSLFQGTTHLFRPRTPTKRPESTTRCSNIRHTSLYHSDVRSGKPRIFALFPRVVPNRKRNEYHVGPPLAKPPSRQQSVQETYGTQFKPGKMVAIQAELMSLIARGEQKPGTDSNGTANMAVIGVLATIGGIFFIGMLYMLWAALAGRRYGEEIDDE